MRMCPPLVGIKESAAGDMLRSVAEGMYQPVGEDMHWMAEEHNPVVEVAAGQPVYKSARHQGPDSPSHTYIANRHCHIASEPPFRLQRKDLFLR